MTFMRDVTAVWWASLDSLIVMEVLNFMFYELTTGDFDMLLSILLPANKSKKGFCT